ncbi:MAG: alcohol dehydrogenase, partial [Acidobacteriota bacterium]
GNLVFWGDLNRRFRAFDAITGEILWESIVGGTVSVSNITYAVEGKQYIAVITGDTRAAADLLQKAPQFKPPLGHRAIYVFALEEERE